jgi:hypothetical protein
LCFSPFQFTSIFSPFAEIEGFFIKMVDRNGNMSETLLHQYAAFREGIAMSPEATCPLCGLGAPVSREGDSPYVECQKCGTFGISEFLQNIFRSQRDTVADVKELLPYLSAHTRQASERGDTVILNHQDWKKLALAHKDTPISKKLFALLEFIARSAKPGTRASVRDTDAPLFDAFDRTELDFLLTTQSDVGFIDRVGSSNSVSLKAKGWEQIQAATVNGIPGKCFVAMSFHESLSDAYWSGIYLAVKEDCRMDPIRLDLVQHNEKICDKIVADIRTCQFLIADVTRASANVYFEAGFAMALGRTVIWTCCDGTFNEDVRFDTRQYPYIRWKNPADLREQLKDRIKATILPSGSD